MSFLNNFKNCTSDILKNIPRNYRVFFFDVDVEEMLVFFGFCMLPLIYSSQDSIFFCQLAFVLLFHELGHLSAMKYFKYKNLELRFKFIFAQAIGEKEETNPNEELLILLAGPIPGIALGYVLMLSSLYINIPEKNTIYFLLIVINGLHMLPIIPFDGGQLFRIMIFYREKDNLFFLIYSLIVLTVLQLIFSDFILFIFCFYLLTEFALGLFSQQQKDFFSLIRLSTCCSISDTRRVMYILVWLIFFLLGIVFYFNPLIRHVLL